MALCERCQVEIIRPQDRLPEPWFDQDAHTIAGQWMRLSCWRVLEILWQRRGKMVSRDSLMTLLYSHLRDPPEDRIPVYVSFLRPALKATPFVIQNERGRGYRLIERGELVIYYKKSQR